MKGVHPAVRSETSELPLILAATVTCLLLIACANLAGLLLARGASRHKEIGIRLALGAGRGRLIRQLLSESLLLSLLGGVTGLMITSWANDLLARYYTAEVEGVRPFYVLSLDWSVFLYSLLLTVVTGLAFGLAPALQASRPALVSILKEDASAFSYRRSRLRSAFLVSQVALSVVLLIGAGLIIQSLQRLKWRPGFDAQKVVFIRMKPHLSGYNREKSIAYFREVQRRLESLSGVQSVTFAGYPPLRDWGAELRVSLPGHEPSRAEDILRVKQNGVTHEFFEALKIPVLRGRTFDAHDLQEGQQSVIVNETLAQYLWPNQEAVGQTIMVEGKPHEVVGVTKISAGMVRLRSLFSFVRSLEATG